MRIETKTWWTIVFENNEIQSAWENESLLMGQVMTKMLNSKRKFKIWEHTISNLGKYSKTYIGSFKGANYDVNMNTNSSCSIPRKKELPILGMDIYSE